jgi:6-phosphofructokinase 1
LNRVYALNDMRLATTMFIPASVENEFLNPSAGVDGDRGVHAESIGADTAANTALEAIDRLREQSYLTRTVFMIQSVGVKSNFLPVQIGLACGAHRIYLPPFPPMTREAREEVGALFGASFDPHRVDMKELVEWIDRMFSESKKSYLVIIIPSGIPLGQVLTGTEEDDSNTGKYERMVSSMAPIELTTLKVVEGLMMHYEGNERVQTRYVVLDDLQRGGAPTLRDRMLGSIYGEAAVEEFLSIIKSQEFERRGTLNLLGVDDTFKVAWRCYPRAAVLPLFSGPNPRAGGLDPLPFFRPTLGEPEVRACSHRST